MATVPSYNGSQAAPSSLPGGSFNAPQVQNAAPQQLQQLGETTQRAGQQLGNIAIDMQQQVNQVRVDATLNKVREQMLKLTYDPNDGYRGLTGDAALTRPNGKMLSDEYGEKLQTSISELSGSLGNDVQRQAFSASAADLLNQFRGGIQQHELGEYRRYSLSTQEGTIKLGVEEAKRNWQDPEKIKLSLDSVRAAVVRTGTLEGWSGNETTAKLREMTSSVHSNVIDTALNQSNPEYAMGYLERFKDEMTADDVLKVRGVITKDVHQRIADGIATNVVMGARAAASPSDIQRMVSITEQADGKPAAPVVPGTKIDLNNMTPAQKKAFMAQAEAQFALRPGAQPSGKAPPSADLGTMVKKYAGDPQKAWAAYKLGADKVDAVIKEHGAGWLAHVPPETQAYVSKNMAALSTGAGTAKPTLQDVHDQVRAQVTARFGATPPPAVMKLALTTATQQFEDMRKAQKDDEDNRVTAAMQAIVANGGSYGRLPFAVRAQIPADKVDSVLNFASRVAKGDDTTNPAVYLRLSDPQALRKLSDNEFYQLRAELSESDFKHFSNQRAAVTGKGGGNKLEEINMSAMNFVLNNRMDSLGIPKNPKGEDAARLGVIKQFVADGMLQQQKLTGKQMTDGEVSQYIDGLFAKSVSFRTEFLGLSTGSGSQKLMSMKAGDIPDDTKQRLIADFQAAGIREPSEADLLGAYLRLKTATPRAKTVRNPLN